MFEFIKNIIAGKPSETQAGGTSAPASVASRPVPASALKSSPGNAAAPKSYSNGNAFSLPVANPSAPAKTFSPAPLNSNGGGVQLPLHTIVNGLPVELRNRVRPSEIGSATVTISMDTVLSQLSQGAVKISFGELRQAAPEVFAGEGDLDYLPVALPLNEILLRINPALLVRRQNQKQVQVPEDIRSPFGDQGDGLIFSARASKAPAAAPAPTRSVTPAPPPQPAPIQPAPVSPQPAPVNRITSAPPALTPSRPPTPASATPPSAPPKPAPFRNPFASAPTPPPPVTRPAGPPPTSPAPIAFRGVGASPAPRELTPAHASATPRDPVSPPATSASEAPALNVSLIALMQSWPEAVRQEITQQNLMEAKIALPVEAVEQALKRGKVAFPWKLLRSWIRPSPSPSASAQDSAMLELPLKVVAPLFLNRQKETGQQRQKKVAVDENIPNLFFGFPQPSALPTAEPVVETDYAVSKPVDTNYYVWDDNSDSARVDETEFKRKSEMSPGTNFTTRCSTPNEVVSRAAALEGVAGALIALPDGLMVASHLSGDLNGDTLAAFLPHIFGKVSQCTRELRMGELNNLNFTVGNVPWKIFRVNAIFFAVFGRPGQPLPTGQLASLAKELDRKKQ